jgi:hypothetical protein
MANVRRTAMGDGIDMDMLRLANENTIAVGNMKVNARGDQLGPGGKVIKTRAQVMSEHHALNMSTQLATHDDEIRESIGVESDQSAELVIPTNNVLQPTAVDEPVAESESIPSYTKPRGSFAEAVAGQTEVSQELLEPASSRNQPKGIQRI